jgi:hypothetical protein
VIGFFDIEFMIVGNVNRDNANKPTTHARANARTHTHPCTVCSDELTKTITVSNVEGRKEVD